jgi:serine/threonine-protein kinase
VKAPGLAGVYTPNVDPDPTAPLVGQVIAGRYEVVQLIGEGGMGQIYEVQHLRLRRSFAMKKLEREYAKNPEALARFHREADAVARLRHPHIVAITDWETLEDGSPCIIMEYLAGRDLAERIDRTGQLPWSFVGRIADQVMSALSAAHRAGVVHRDLKPSNIFLVDTGPDEWWVKLLDFGLSKVKDAGHFQTTTGDQMFGTPAYMSPEQARGRSAEIGPPSDVWAMAVVLYQMATARLPFEADSPMSMMYRICHEHYDPIRRYRADTSDALVSLLDRALCRDLDERIATIDEFRAEMRDALADVASNAFPEPLPTIEVTQTGVAIAPADSVEPSSDEPHAGPSSSSATVPHSGDIDTPVPSLSSGIPRRAIAIGLTVAGAAIALLLWSQRDATETAQREPASPAAATHGAFDAAAPVEQIEITVANAPAGTLIRVDGRAVEGTVTHVTRDSEPHHVEVSAPGYISQRFEVDGASPSPRAVTLDKEKPKQTRPRRKKRKRRKPKAVPPGPLQP